MIILGQGTAADPAHLPLYTKKRTFIANAQKPERPPAAMQAAQTLLRGKFPAIKVRSLSATYNCVGLVFGSRRTAIDPDQLATILSDDGYKQLGDRNDVGVGDVAIYYKELGSEPTHIALITEIEYRASAGTRIFHCLSQWGQDGEYFHVETEVPDWFGKHIQYFTERV